MGFEQERENVALNWETLDPAEVQRFLSTTVPVRIDELAREVERLRAEAESHLKECGRLSERRHRENAALRALLLKLDLCLKGHMIGVNCKGPMLDEETQAELRAALGAGKETQP